MVFNAESRADSKVLLALSEMKVEARGKVRCVKQVVEALDVDAEANATTTGCLNGVNVGEREFATESELFSSN